MSSNGTREHAHHTLVSPEIVVGIDGGPAAAAALHWAAQQSRTTGMPLRVVHAWGLTTLGAAAVTAGAGDVEEALAADARARSTRWVRDTLGAVADTLRWSLEIVEGSPGPVLVERSRQRMLLVLGTQEHNGLRRAVLGSVSHYCLSHAVPPVVGVPPAASHTGDGCTAAEGVDMARGGSRQDRSRELELR